MAKTVPLDASTLAWARGEFARYYGGAEVAAPERLERRELAAFPFADAALMRRHTTVPTEERLRSYLRETVPRHVYYSSAYYRRPAEPTMAAKEWLGADLIFDLDADHLRGAEKLDYAGQLTLVKRRLTDLVDDFLVRDFGIDPEATQFVFSGGRGYHVHIRDERFIPLTSPERREIVDYILGTGVVARDQVRERLVDVGAGMSLGGADASESTGRRTRAARALELAPADSPGWAGHTTQAVFRALDEWEHWGPDRAAEEIAASGIPRALARRWAREIVAGGLAERIRSSRTLDGFKGKASPEAFLSLALARIALNVQGETDAPVTTDIHRLIRLPDSLHGGTGFRVVPLSRAAVDRFEPFRDATIDGGERSVAVTYLQEVRHPFPGNGLHGVVGSSDELPPAQALFLVLRGEAALRPSPG